MGRRSNDLWFLTNKTGNDFYAQAAVLGGGDAAGSGGITRIKNQKPLVVSTIVIT
jgi:hypothetical protein